MTTDHRKTWRLWLEKIAPFYGDLDADSMAEALSLAAPGGPRGFKCVDACECDEVRVQDVVRFTLERPAGVCDVTGEAHEEGCVDCED